MEQSQAPNRWLHLFHPKGFNEELYAKFLVHSEYFQAFVSLTISYWKRLGAGDYEPSPYIFFAPYLSCERKLITLPIGGEFSLGTRNAFEDSSSNLLWQNLPIFFTYEMLEGFTEYMPIDITKSNALHIQTHWRQALDKADKGLSPTFDPITHDLIY